MRMSWRRLLCLGAIVIGSGAASGAPYVVTEDFADNPVTAGRGSLQGPGSGHFAFDDAGRGSQFAGDPAGEMVVTYNSSLPTQRFIRPVSATITGNDDFAVEAIFSITSASMEAFSVADIAMGLLNSVTTGFNRTGTQPTFGDANVFDSVEFTYSPDSGFGAFLFPAVFGSALGPDVYLNFASTAFGEGLGALPIGSLLRATMSYNRTTQRLIIEVHLYPSLTPLAFGEAAGETDGTVDINVTPVNIANTFETNALGVPAYQNLDDPTPASPVLTGSIAFDRLRITVTGPDSDGDGTVDAVERFAGTLTTVEPSANAPAASFPALLLMTATIIWIGLRFGLKRRIRTRMGTDIHG